MINCVKLKYYIFYSFVLCFLISLNAQNDDLIYWSSNNKLGFNDFKKTQGQEFYQNSMLAANSSIVFDYKFLSNGRVSPPIASFEKLNSWIVQLDSLVLRHEQVHFDIGELFARKMRKEFIGLYQTNNNIRQNYLDIINKNMKEIRTMNNRFDAVSYEYSPLRGKPWDSKDRSEFCRILEDWENKVKIELQKLEQFNLN